MLHVFRKHLLIREGCKQPKGHLSVQAITVTVLAYRTMDAVMGSDKQTGIQISLDQDMEIEKRGGEVWVILCEHPSAHDPSPQGAQEGFP